MIWIVDGTRLQKDLPRFIKAEKNIVSMDIPKVFGIEFADECFPKKWLGSSVPVIFDFEGSNPPLGIDKNNRAFLYCVFPIQVGWLTIFAEISRKALIKSIIDGEWQTRYSNFMDVLIERNKQEAKQREKNQQMTTGITLNQFLVRRYMRKKRRF